MARLASDIVRPVLEPLGIKRERRSAVFRRREENGDEVVFEFAAFPLGNDGYSFINHASMTPGIYDRWLQFEGRYDHVGHMNAFLHTDVRSQSTANTSGNLWEFAVHDHAAIDDFQTALGMVAKDLVALLRANDLLALTQRLPFDGRLRCYPPEHSIALAMVKAERYGEVENLAREIGSRTNERSQHFSEFLRSVLPRVS